MDTQPKAQSVLIDGYCERKGLTLIAFGNLARLSRTTMHRLRAGNSEISVDAFDRVETASEGEIGAVELFKEWRAKRKRAEAAAHAGA